MYVFPSYHLVCIKPATEGGWGPQSSTPSLILQVLRKPLSRSMTEIMFDSKNILLKTTFKKYSKKNLSGSKNKLT